MITNINEIIESVSNLLFGKVSVEIMQDSVVVECTYNSNTYNAKGRFLIKDGNINFVFINTKEYDPEIDTFWTKELTKLARKDPKSVAEVLEIFEDCHDNFGYDPTIKVKGTIYSKYGSTKE